MTVPDEKDCSTPHVTLCAGSKSSLFPYSKRKAAQTENINLSINKQTNQPTHKIPTTHQNRDYQCVKSKISANLIENFMTDFNDLAGQQTIFSLAQNQCNKIFEISINIILPCKPIKNVSAKHDNAV